MGHAQRIALEECRVQVINPGEVHSRPKAVGKRRGRIVAGIKRGKVAAARIQRARQSGEPALEDEQEV